jgi:haloalkane dehalogenase
LEGGVGTMVLLDSISFDSWPIEAVRMLQAADPGKADEDFVRGAVGLALDLGLAHGDRLAEADREAYLRPWMEAPAALIRAARAIDGLGLTGTEGRLGALDARVLLVWGEEDPYQPAEQVERLADVLPGSTAALLPGCAHFVTEDAPEAVLPLVAEYLRVHHLRAEHHHHAGPTPVELGISFDRPAPGHPEA